MCKSASHKGDLPAIFATKEVVGEAGTVFLEQPVANAMFRPVSGQTRGFGFIEVLSKIFTPLWVLTF